MRILLLLVIWTCVSCRPLPPFELPSGMETDLEESPRTTWMLDIESTELLPDMKFGVIAAIPLFILLVFLVVFAIIIYCTFCRKKPET